MAKAAWGRVEGMKEAREALQELDRRTQIGVGKRALRAPGEVFVRAVKAKAPVSRRAGNPTPGSLRESITIGDARTSRGSARLAIIADDVAAVPNEFGTSKMTAQPFFRPAVDAHRAEAAGAMADSVKTEVDAAVAKAARRGKRR